MRWTLLNLPPARRSRKELLASDDGPEWLSRSLKLLVEVYAGAVEEPRDMLKRARFCNGSSMSKSDAKRFNSRAT